MKSVRHHEGIQPQTQRKAELRDPAPWIPIKYKLPLTFILICLVSLGVASLVGYRTTKDILWGEVRRDLLTIRESRAHEVVAYLDLLQKLTTGFGWDGFIQEAADTLQRSPSGELQESLCQYLTDTKLSIVPDLLETLVLDRKGQVVASSTRENVGRSMAGEPAFQKGQRGIFLGEVRRRGAGLERPFFEIAAPLRRMADGSSIGVMVSRVNLQGLSLQINQKDHAENIFGGGKRVDSYLVDRQGYLVAVPSFLSNPELLQKKRVAMPPPLRGSEREVLIGTSPLVAGKEVLLGSVSVPGTAWILVTEIGTREAFLEASLLQRKLLLVGTGVIGMSLVLSLFPLRLMIIPLLRLREAAEKLEAGKLPPSIEGTPNSEMGQLARAFNRLSAGLLERTRKLEQYATEVEEKERKIAYERDLLNAVIHGMKAGLIFIDREDRVALCNSAATEVFHVEQNLEKPVTDCDPQQLFSNVKSVIDSLKQEGPSGTHRMIKHQWLIKHHWHSYEGTYTRVNDHRGNYLGILLIIRDITERKRMEEMLIRQEKLTVIGELSATIAHELNNPLATISMFSQLLEEELPQSSSLREYSEVIRRNIFLCKRIIRGLMDYAVRSPGEKTVIDIRHCLEDMAALARPLLEDTGIQLTVEISEALPPFEGDEEQIKRVFLNLILNAIQAMPQGGSLSIRAAAEGASGAEAQVLVEITDTGEGIEEGHLQEIFQPFFTTKDKERGMGLGLSICQRFVEAHDGQIQVRSQRGSGTTFAVSLPVRESAPPMIPGEI